MSFSKYKIILNRYFHTLRFLRFVQVYQRVYRRFRSLNTDQPDTVGVRSGLDQWCRSLISNDRLNSTGEFDFFEASAAIVSPADWNDFRREKLWNYNLHYFEDLVSVGSAERAQLHRCLVTKWIDDNPPLQGNGWEPYPQSLRIVNWIKWFLNGEQPEPAWLDSLALQVHVLSQDLEYHLLGNHLFENAKALIFAGTYLQGGTTERWLDKGLEIVDVELGEQVLLDGGNFELSPMYHNLMLHGLLDLINLAVTSKNLKLVDRLPLWRSKASAMLGWMKAMLHSDGEVAFFNDSAIGVAAAPALLEEYATKLAVPVSTAAQRYQNGDVDLYHFKDSGYLSVAGAEFKALLDCASVGPSYLPGHAHADTLSFELSIRGQRVFVNSGTSCYGLSAERSRQRESAAHNTVDIDGQSSSEVWGGFRVARRANPSIPSVAVTDGFDISCSHDGYRRLATPLLHRRSWFVTGDSMRVCDEIGSGAVNAKAYYHLHPSVAVAVSDGGFLLTLPAGGVVRVAVSGGAVAVEESSWHPQFGLSLPNKRIAISIESNSLEVNMSWG